MVAWGLACSCDREQQTASAVAFARTAPDPTFGPCTEGDPSKERHGSSCLCCHKSDFGVAGSVAADAGIAEIIVWDKNGDTAQMAPNPHDNFFRRRKLEPPISAVIFFDDGTQKTMSAPAPHGSCNACHGQSVAMLGAR